MDKEAGSELRARIVAAAAELVAKGGVRAATTRAVSQAASVQPPTIYRQFGDKDGLLDAVAEQVFTAYVAGQERRSDGDPVRQLRDGFDSHVAFGLAHPAVFFLISAPQDEGPSRVNQAGLAVLAGKVRAVAGAGRLKVSEEQAVALIHAMGTGTVLMLLCVPPSARDGLAASAREAVMAAVLDGRPAAPAAATAPNLAAALRTHVEDLACLSPGERLLLDEWLQRIGDRAA